jgi:TolB-like protein
LTTQPSKGVFLSYASEDSEAAARIATALTSAGIDVWFDKSELRGGDAWDQKIRQKIRDCALFIPIISEQTQSRPEGYFRLEWKLAVDRSHLIAVEKAFLVPVLVDATTESEALVPAPFRDVQWTRLPSGEVPAPFVSRIASLIHQPVVHHAGNRAAATSPNLTRRRPIARVALATAAVAGIVIAVLMRSGLGHKPSAVPAKGTGSASATELPADIPEKSVAVLPFVDMSEKHDQEYFSDGLAEELIDRLARISGLRVSARTSSFYFKGKSVPISQIGRDLGVAHIVEGSVRKDGNIVRITAQLIRVDTEDHLWSVSFERPFKDIFKTQDAIASAIASALKIKVSDKVNYGGYDTKSPEAFDLYLQSMNQTQRTWSSDQIQQRLANLTRAVALDPGYSDAWSAIANLSTHLAITRAGPPDSDLAARAKDAAKHAIETGPQNARAYRCAAQVHIEFDFDGKGAVSAFRRAIEIEPHSTTGLASAIQLHAMLGETALAGMPPRRRLRSIPSAKQANPTWRKPTISMTNPWKQRSQLSAT